MRLVLYKEQMKGMLVGVTPRPFWYISSGEPVVVVLAYLFRRRAGPGAGPLFLTDYGQTVGRIGILGILG